jgi:uncharacterized radical SAM superfamily Fe-S cluster-containing enzyme
MDVYLEKTCPQHGRSSVIIWRGEPELWAIWERFNDWEPERFDEYYFKMTSKRGCPFDCGLCPEHLRKPCFIVMEVTNKCNLDCPVCFADANMKSYTYKPSIEILDEMYKHILKYEIGDNSQSIHLDVNSLIGCCRNNTSLPVIKLSGGEPTIRDDLPDIIYLGKKKGFNIVLDTNGVRIAKDTKYLERLKDSGLDLIYLQFDGVSDNVYYKLRKANLFKIKVKVLENCLKIGLPVILVPTIVDKVNLDQVGEIIFFASKYSRAVKGVMFQPISYFGRYPEDIFGNRVTIPDMLHAIEQQTGGSIKISNFIPIRAGVGCEAHCGFSSLVVVKDSKLVPVTSLPKNIDKYLETRTTISRETRTPKHSREVLRKYWFSTNAEDSHDNYLWISGMHFQDVWNIDIRRLRKCCIHEITPSGHLIPFCIFNLTNLKGETLYRDKFLNLFKV